MVMHKHKVGLIREVPRNAATTQRLAMEEARTNVVLDLAIMDRLEVFDHIRKGDAVHVTHLHILAERRKRTDHKPRRDLFWWTLHILERGTIVETSTGRVASFDDMTTLFDMLADAVEKITQGTRGRIARENGKLGGRPRNVPKPDQTALARKLWFERPELAGDRLRKSLRRVGYSRTQAYREFGPRSGRD